MASEEPPQPEEGDILNGTELPDEDVEMLRQYAAALKADENYRKNLPPGSYYVETGAPLGASLRLLTGRSSEFERGRAEDAAPRAQPGWETVHHSPLTIFERLLGPDGKLKPEVKRTVEGVLKRMRAGDDFTAIVKGEADSAAGADKTGATKE